MTKASGDGGIDIEAVLDKPFVGGKFLIQCKRFSPETVVGSPTVRQFQGAISVDRGAKGILVTTSRFSDEAMKFAQSVGIELIDMDRLRTLLIENGVEVAVPTKPKPNLF
jgi:restriction system protein